MKHLTWEECEERYPRLLRAMRWVAILSRPEAACALRDWRSRELYGGEVFGGEAVHHFGGPCRVIKEAIRCRSIVRRLAKEQGR